jgi:fructose-bisphosphate aldolase class II
MKELLSLAEARRCAVGSFNVYSRETARGAIAASLRTREPIVVAFGAAYLINMDFPEIAAEVRNFIGRSEIPVALHLDHCRDLDLIRKALDAGFSSVMFDGSALHFAENAEKTAAAVALAEGYGASVEGELGSLSAGEGSQEGGADDVQKFTDPVQAKDFVALTGVDALAVSIGTVHGFYKGKPDIRTEILDSIRGATDIPLVLHGGSGTPERILLDCIAKGIRKINVNTELSFHTVSRMASAIAANPNIHLSALMLKQIEYFEEAVVTYIELFSLRRDAGE